MPKTITELDEGFNECRAFVGDKLYCAEPTQFGSSFCPMHHEWYWQKVPKGRGNVRSPIMLPVEMIPAKEEIVMQLPALTGYEDPPEKPDVMVEFGEEKA